MNDQPTPFGADDIDEQIDLSAQLLRATPSEETPAPDLRLIDDLHALYSVDDTAVARSLARVRHRLRNSAPPFSQGSMQARSTGRLSSLEERRRPMRFPGKLFSAGQKLSYRIATIAAAVLLVLVIGSLVAGLVLVRHGGTGHQTNKPNTAPTATPVPASSLYVASPAGVYKVDAATGKIRWQAQVPAYSAIVAGDTIYAPMQGGAITALKASDGSTRWTITALESRDGGILRLTVANGVLYVGSEADGLFYAFDASTGKELWHAAVVPADQAAGGAYYAAVQVVDGVLYGSYWLPSGPIYAYLYAASAKDGSVLWRTAAPNEQFFNGPVVADGVLYITSSEISHKSGTEAQDSYAYAYDLNGKLLWQSQKTKGFVFALPAVGDGGVYFGAQQDALYAVKMADGSPMWKYATGALSVYANAHVAGNAVYAGETSNSGSNDFILALDAKSGAVLWKHEILGYFQDEFAVSDQAVYVATFTDTLYALSTKDGSQLWSLKYAKNQIGAGGGSVTLAP